MKIWSGVKSSALAFARSAGKALGLTIENAVEGRIQAWQTHSQHSATRADQAFMANHLHSLW